MIEEIVGFQARLNPHAQAMLTSAGALSFRELDAEVARMAAALEREARFAGTSRIGLAIRNPVRHWLAILAVLRLGRASVSLPTLAPGEVQVAMAAARPDLVLRDTPSPEDAVPSILVDDAWVETSRSFAASLSATARRAPSDLVRITLSSGTTGTPKPIGLTLAHLDASVSTDMTGGAGGRRTLVTMGLQTAAPITQAFVTWARGGAVVIAEANLHWPTVLATLDPDFLIIAPADLRRLVESLPEDFEPSRRMTIYTGGSSVPTALCTDARRRLGARVIVVYGSTEAGLLTRLPATDLALPTGAVGVPVPHVGEVQVIDASGRPLPPGVSGEIRIRGSRVVRGYEDGQDRGVFRDGWFHPGDIGRLMEDDMLVVEGRTAEFINVGGAKYAPMAIEEVVRACPGVRDVAAFAVQAPDGGTAAHLALVLGEDFDAEAANTALRSHFPKLALHVMTLAAIPRNAMGKAEHQTLRRWAAAQRAS